MDQVKIGKFIACCRKEKNITQQNLADSLGISYKTVSNWENGRNMPDVSLFKPLCEQLGIKVNELLNGEDDNTDNGLVDYLKYQKKKNRFKLIISGIVILLIVLLSVLSIFFINNYNKVNGYILTGESENFEYHDDLLILSNIKNINSFGRLDIKNTNIKESDIVLMSLKYNDETMIESGYLNGIAYEVNGYDDCFPKEARDNIDKWYMEITYTLNKEEIIEKIPLTANSILKNDNLFYKKAENVSDGTPVDNSLREKREVYLKALREELLNNRGFEKETIIKDGVKLLSNITLYKIIDNRYFRIYTANGHWSTPNKNHIDVFFGNVRNKFVSYKDINNNTYIYDLDEERIVRCNNKKCTHISDEINKTIKIFVKEYKKEFDGLLNYSPNQKLEDEQEDN